MDKATKHAEDVLSGKVESGELHRLSCKRHLDDLAREGTKDFPYLWKPEKSQRIISFAEDLTISEGFEPKPLKLFDNQCFDFGCRMGWVRQDNGYRRFRRSYSSKARQNGKSLENGVNGPYIAAFSGYKNGKLFTAATDKRQAKIVWNDMKLFIESEKDLAEFFKIKEYCTTIECLITGCVIEALSKESGLKDGFRSIFASIDELHQHKDNSIYKAIENGSKAVPETLISIITTRGKELNSYCYDMDKYCQQILYGAYAAEDFFVDIYTIDKDDDPFDPAVWFKANPVLLHPDNPNYKTNLETFTATATTARDMGGAELADFMTKSLNVWYRCKNNEFVDATKFVLCGIDKSFEDFRGATVNIGLDLSSGGDLTSWTAETKLKNGCFFIDGHAYMPRGRFEEHIKTDVAPYDVWEKKELLTVTGGEMDFKNDYSFIIKELREFVQRFELKINSICYDPHNADGFLSELETFGVPLVPVTQSARNLSEPTEDIQLLVKSGRYFYNRRNELLAHSFLNAVTVANSFGEIKVDKMPGKRNSRIDPVDSAICAHFLSCGKNLKNNSIDVNAELEKYLRIMGGGR